MPEIITEQENGTRWHTSRPIELAPVDMPAQDLDAVPLGKAARRSRAGHSTLGNRFALSAVIALTLLATTIFTIGLSNALALNTGGTILHYVFLAISSLAFSWIAFGSANAAVGTFAIMFGNGGDTIALPPPINRPRKKTALLYPIYHEDPVELAASIATHVESLVGQGIVSSFDVFVLSDSRDTATVERELATFDELGRKLAEHIAIVYRNRVTNEGKKAGNIADWVTRFGSGYPHFIVFDADSHMTAEAIQRLTLAMEQHPGTGLIQTVPRLRNATTRFARLQQFANNLFAPVSAAGFAAWQGTSGNYWGHNAIIRTRAFAESAGLPVLEGAAPWGGHIQSHDFVEAALMRRAGWRIALITSLEGTYESGPPTLVDTAVRDRRWMQGNLQHISILAARGLAPVSRLHLGMGIFAYVSSALWLAMLVTGLFLIWQDEQRIIQYFDEQKSLFPNWPTFDPEAGLRVLAGTVGILLAPKIFGLVIALWQNPTLFVRPLGALRLGGMWLMELVVAALFAPVFMLLHVRSLAQILAGRDSGWASQSRSGRQIPLAMTARFHAGHVAIGILTGVTAGMIAWHALAWVSPIVLGLIGAPFLTHWTSRPLPET